MGHYELNLNNPYEKAVYARLVNLAVASGDANPCCLRLHTNIPTLVRGFRVRIATKLRFGWKKSGDRHPVY